MVCDVIDAQEKQNTTSSSQATFDFTRTTLL